MLAPPTTSLTLGKAARRVGLHRSNLLRAIGRGQLSATRAADGKTWLIDESELVRVFPKVHSPPLQPAQAAQAPAQADEVMRLKLEHAEQRICDLTRQLERAHADIADWKEQARRIVLPPPDATHQPAQAAQAAAPPPWWRRAW